MSNQVRAGAGAFVGAMAGAAGEFFTVRPMCEAELLRERGALCGIGHRHHRIILRQSPLRTVLLGRETLGGRVALQGLANLAVLDVDEAVGLNRLFLRIGIRHLAGKRYFASIT